MFYVWLSIGLALAIIEMTTINLVSIWFVISSIITMIVSLITDNIYIQFTIFVVVGVILMTLTKKFVNKLMPVKEKTNIDRIIGMTGIVTEKITPKNPGEVKVDGKKWTAISNEKLEEDTEVKIIEINSTKLTVKRMED